MKPTVHQGGGECGAVLIVSLFLLVVLTLLGITVMQGTTMETRMASNREDQTIAFEAAEAALRQGEKVIQAMSKPPTAVGATCPSNCVVWKQGTLFQRYASYVDSTIWADPRISTANVPLAGVAAPPTYAIELIQVDRSGGSFVVGTAGRMYYFQVTARGTGRDSDTHVVLQSAVARYFAP